MEFDGYEVYDPGVEGPWRDLARAAARAAFARLMAAKAARLEQLADVLRRSGIRLPPPSEVTDQELGKLESWLVEGIGNDPDSGDGELATVWYSIISDLALYIGDVMISRAENLSWVLHTAAKKSNSYQESVISGFQAAPNPKFFLNPGFLLVGLARKVAREEPVEEGNVANWVQEAVYWDVDPD